VLKSGIGYFCLLSAQITSEAVGAIAETWRSVAIWYYTLTYSVLHTEEQIEIASDQRQVHFKLSNVFRRGDGKKGRRQGVKLEPSLS
jgi:hypothetical protein